MSGSHIKAPGFAGGYLLWTLANRRSKSWQESWELRAQHYFDMVYGGELTKNIYQGVRDSGLQKKEMFLLRHGNYSLSKLLTVLSDFSLIFFLGVAVYIYPFSSDADGIGIALQDYLKTNAALAFSIFGSVYVVYIVVFCRSKAQFIDKSELPEAHNKANPADAEKPRG
ncbi:hypothetical protein [Ectothiorhodospira variabilis]|uniref:hypothetical protein n=1 Tax=Ectothiorhodospira variabilis TaxID=505694 RepID=UPI001EFB4A89|nr:hypothetical protein [Ectothiorhodospira variabilis]MCG5496046.1 hypothetical protein [Ectothiorhodospira variabilis]MCG5505407.1 hypothetical protein [Ectothiorhodospira variabilis]MCG5508592.1 hypothetical protein [Ectothiorhodospira variabilis]